MPLDWRPPGGKRLKTQVLATVLRRAACACAVSGTAVRARVRPASAVLAVTCQAPPMRPSYHLTRQPATIAIDNRRGLVARTAVTDSGSDSISNRSGRRGGPGGASGGRSGGGGEGCIGTAAAGCSSSSGRLQWLERQVTVARAAVATAMERRSPHGVEVRR